MSTSSSTTHDDSFICECEDWMRSACRGEIFYKEHYGKRYCVLHYPGKEKSEEFEKSLQRKLDDKDFDFRGVWFPDDVSFENFTFNVAADFSGAQFNAIAIFKDAQFSDEANFSGAQFSTDASFNGARFSAIANFGYAQFSADADFKGAQFSADAYFSDVQFKNTDFRNAVFNANVYFQQTWFIGNGSREISANVNNEPISSDGKVVLKAKTIEVSFDGARFKDSVSFEDNIFADQVLLSFAAAVFEQPERVTFHTVSLRPHWFINVDPRKFNFISVSWGFLDKPDAVRKEINALEDKQVGHLRRLLVITFRQLAVNAEENNRYEEAADFRYMAMDMKRLERWRKVDLFRLSWWYWLLSGYGERVQRAFGALVSIWLLFAIIYWLGDATWWQPRQTGGTVSESSARDAQPMAVAMPLTIPEALVYSVGVMALQKPEPLPANKRAKAFVIFETILGPLQAALLALAIRRKFMR